MDLLRAVCFLKGEKQMSHEKTDMRVLGRVGSRIITQEEINKVTGGEGLPTSHLSRDPSGRPIDITND
jgi:hypothetical protein